MPWASVVNNWPGCESAPRARGFILSDISPCSAPGKRPNIRADIATKSLCPRSDPLGAFFLLICPYGKSFGKNPEIHWPVLRRQTQAGFAHDPAGEFDFSDACSFLSLSR